MSKRPASLLGRIFLAFALVTVLAAVLPMLLSRDPLYADRLDLAREQALGEAALAASFVDAGAGEAQLDRLFSAGRRLSRRITLISPEGRVLRDSHVKADDLDDMDNHGDRPEIEEALQVGSGTSFRHSNSLGIDAMYAAIRLDGGGALRVAVPMADIRRGFEREVASLGLIIAGVAAFCLLLSVFITSRICRGIRELATAVTAVSRGAERRRLHRVPGSEFMPLVDAVNVMAENIETHSRREAGQRGQLESILDSIHEGVLVLGPAGAILRFNPAMLRLFPDLEKCHGRQLIEGIASPALQLKVERMLKKAGPGERPKQESMHLELPAGRFLVAHLSRPVGENPELGAVLVFYDATELMRLERVRRDFVANVSHELRTPLTAVAGYSETLMNMEEQGPEARRFAGIIHKHATALSRVIDALLQLSRIESAREEIAPGALDPAGPLNEALELCADEAARKKVDIRIALEPADKDSRLVRGNARLLAQVFKNLLENALRYSPEGGVVHVACEKLDSELLFSVSDQGPGIPGAELERIFERFYQVRKERNSGSAGIGLAICKHIVERHGGRIYARSPYGRAATAILFTLPLCARAGVSS